MQKLILLVLGLPLLLTSCKPVTTQTIRATLETSPSEAYVYQGYTILGQTPIKLPETSEAYTVFKPGFTPVQLTLTGTAIIKLIPQSEYYYEIFIAKNQRFVFRRSLNALMIEPINRAVTVGASYVVIDPNTGKDLVYRVESILPRLVELSVNEASIFVPIIYFPDDINKP